MNPIIASEFVAQHRTELLARAEQSRRIKLARRINSLRAGRASRPGLSFAPPHFRVTATS